MTTSSDHTLIIVEIISKATGLDCRDEEPTDEQNATDHVNGSDFVSSPSQLEHGDSIFEHANDPTATDMVHEDLSQR